MDNSPETQQSYSTLTDDLCFALLDAFPASTREHIYHEYRGGRSRARVMAVRLRATGPGGLSGPFVVKFGTDLWADQEESFYRDSMSAALAPLLAPKHVRSASRSGFSAIAYDLAFDSVFAQSLSSLLDGRSVEQTRIQKQVDHIARGLITWYLAQPSHSWKPKSPNSNGNCTDALQHMLTERRVADLRDLLRPWFDSGNIEADWLQLDGEERRLPNPISYLYHPNLWPEEYRPFLRTCWVHGDLHADNILCDGKAEQIPTLIDFGQSIPDGIPFFDLAYLEFDLLQHVLPLTVSSHRRDWLQLLHIAMSKVLPERVSDGHARIAWELIQPVREQVQCLIDSYPDGKEDAEFAWWLSTIAAGLNWARKGGNEPRLEERYAGLLYAALGLKHILEAHFPPRRTESGRALFIPWFQIAATSMETRHDFFDLRAPSLDATLVERTREIEHAREVILQATESSVAITSAVKARATALHGFGGIGKSVLARVLCEDPLVRRTFRNGVLWATIGESPKPSDLSDRLRDWIIALGGAIPGSAPSLDLLHQKLEELLRDRSYLLVVDDVWQFEHLELFRTGGPNCRLIFTTRVEAIATKIGARVVHVPVMNEVEAISLLEAWADGGLEGQSNDVKGKLADRLGRLPLALRLAGPQLRDTNPDEWLESFDITKAHLPDSDESEDVHDSLEATFELSLRRLDDGVRQLLFALAIFKEDEPIPDIAVLHLWHGLADLDVDKARRLLEKLRANALIEVLGPQAQRVVLLHDLMRELFARRLEANWQHAHEALLSSYRFTITLAGWHTAEDDGYLYDHLTYHLSAVGAYEELMKLFRDDRWLEARVRRRGYTNDGYLADLSNAFDLSMIAAMNNIVAHREPATLSDYLHCLLIRASINSVSENYSPEQVEAAVESGSWSTNRALSVVSRVPDARKRLMMSVALSRTNKLIGGQRSRLDEIISESLKTVSDSAWVMAEMAPHNVADLDRHLAYSSFMLVEESVRANAINALSGILTAEGIEGALEAVMAIGVDLIRAQALVALAPRLGTSLRHDLVDRAHTRPWTQQQRSQMTPTGRGCLEP